MTNNIRSDEVKFKDIRILLKRACFHQRQLLPRQENEVCDYLQALQIGSRTYWMKWGAGGTPSYFSTPSCATFL
jgi:hypothetical protein